MAMAMLLGLMALPSALGCVYLTGSAHESVSCHLMLLWVHLLLPWCTCATRHPRGSGRREVQPSNVSISACSKGCKTPCWQPLELWVCWGWAGEQGLGLLCAEPHSRVQHRQAIIRSDDCLPMVLLQMGSRVGPRAVIPDELWGQSPRLVHRRLT